MRPRSMCSVPMNPWFRSRASSWARTRTRRARSVNRSNTAHRVSLRRHRRHGLPAPGARSLSWVGTTERGWTVVDRIDYDEFGLFHENAEEYDLPFDGPPVV